MTNITNRNNNKPMFWFIAGMMVQCSCFITTRALQRLGWNQVFSKYSILNNVLSFNFFLISFAIFSRTLSSSWASLLFAAFFIVAQLAFFSMSVFSISLSFAIFASPIKIVFSRFVLKKLTKGFNFFTSSTFLCYDWFRHGFFLIKKSCLEPLQDRFLCGSSYYMLNSAGVK